MQNTLAALASRIEQHRSLVPIAFTLLVLLGAFVAGIKSGVATSIGFLDIDMTGLTAALSSDDHGLKGKPYQGYKEVRDSLRSHGLAINELNFPNNFRDYSTLTAALQAAAAVDVCGSPLVSQMYNDQGAIEFIHAAFWLFGVDVKSLYYFYFALLASSIAVYLIVFWRDYSACALLSAAAFAVYSFMPSVLPDNDQLISVSNPRFLSTLGLVPLLHIILTFVTARTPTIGLLSLLALLFQAAFVGFVVAIRSTSLWMEIAFWLVVAIYFIVVVLRAARSPNWSAFYNPLFSRGTVALYVVATLLMCSSFRGLFVLPACDEGLGAHTFWHNAFIGIGLLPGWRQVLRADGFPISDEVEGDSLSYDAAKFYVESHHLPYQTTPSIFIANAQTRRIGEDPAPLGSWQTYEQIMRRIVLDFMWKHPKLAFELLVIYKPLWIIQYLSETSLQILKDLLFIKLLGLAIMIGFIGGFAPKSALTIDPKIRSRSVRFAMAGLFACVILLLVALVVSLRVQVPASSWGFGAVLAAFLILGGVGALRWSAGDLSVTTHESEVKFHQTVAILAFCFLISTSPLIAAHPAPHLIVDQSFLATAGIVLCLIWAVAKERSVNRRRLGA